MTREEAYEKYGKRYQHKTIEEKGREFNSPAWEVVTMICRVLLFPVFLIVRIFRWTYHME